MNLRDAFGHCMEAGQFMAQEGVVRFNNVFGQLGGGQVRGIVNRIGFGGQFRIQLIDHGVDGDFLKHARLAESASSLTTEVDLKGLEYAGTTRTFSDKFSDGAIGDGCAQGRKDVWFMAHSLDFSMWASLDSLSPTSIGR